MVNDALSVEPAPATNVKVNVSPASGSVAVSVPTVVPAGWFSSMELGDSAIPAGAEPVGSTPVAVNASDGEPPGVALTPMLPGTTPLAVAAKVTSMVHDAPAASV